MRNYWVVLLIGCCAAMGAERPEPATWFAGDPHAHRGILCGRSNADRMLTPEELREMMKVNDLDVLPVLGDIGNGEIREASVDLPLVGKSDALLHWDAEWHFDPQGVTFEQKAIGGHLIVLGLQHAEVVYHEYTHPVIDWAQKQGAVVGFAHMQYLPDGFPEKMSCCDPLEYPVEVALGSGVFLMEDVRGSETALPHYYRMLNCGFRPGLAAGTDYPCDSPPQPLGNLLTYVHVPDGQLTYRKWIDGIAGGHTVISRNAHNEFLELKVNGEAGPGDEVKLPHAGPVRVAMTWTVKQPAAGRVELVQNGKVVSSHDTQAAPGEPRRLQESVEFAKSGWICARRMDAKGHVLHTAAVFVSVGGAPMKAQAEDAQFYVRYLERLLEKTGPGGEWSGYFHAERDPARARYQAALAVFQRLASKGGESAHSGGTARITVNPAEVHQTVQGFGLNFTGPYFRDDQKPMFDMAIDDLGVTMWRVVPYLVYSNWEETNDNDDPAVMNWEYYNERYSGPAFEASWKGLRFLNSRGAKPILALMGPVPDWMVSEKWTPPQHRVCSPESRMPALNPAKYDEFAEMVVSMAVYARRKAGVDFEYFSPFNETDCYPPEGPRVDPEEAPKVLGAVARRLAAEGLGDVRLTVADNAIISNDYTGLILRDDALMRYVGALAVHDYGDGSVAPHVERVRNGKYPKTPVWLTEYGDLNDRDRSAENDWKNYSLAANRRALKALNDGAQALFYFDLFDDYEECAKRETYYGLFSSADHLYTPRKRYFATRQLYHFVRPGAQRISATVDSTAFTVSGFLDPGSNSVVLVGVKQGGPDRVEVHLPGGEATSWDLFVTTRDLNCTKMGPVKPLNGVAQLALPAEAVFTLVGTLGR